MAGDATRTLLPAAGCFQESGSSGSIPLLQTLLHPRHSLQTLLPRILMRAAPPLLCLGCRQLVQRARPASCWSPANGVHLRVLQGAGAG